MSDSFLLSTPKVDVVRAHSIALLVSGGIRGGRNDKHAAGAKQAVAFHDSLLSPLLSRGYLVKLFLCTDPEPPAAPPPEFLAAVRAWANQSVRVFVHHRRWYNQFERLEDCFNASRRVGHAGAGKGEPSSKDFDLYIRLRPDAVWYEPISIPSTSHVSLRARILALPDPGATPLMHAQIMSLSCQRVVGPTECTVFDDQFAIVPQRFATRFFASYRWYLPGVCPEPTARPVCPEQLEGHFPIEGHFSRGLMQCGLPILLHPFGLRLAAGKGATEPKTGSASFCPLNVTAELSRRR